MQLRHFNHFFTWFDLLFIYQTLNDLIYQFPLSMYVNFVIFFVFLSILVFLYMLFSLYIYTCFNVDSRDFTRASEKTVENISVPDFLIRNYFKLYSSSKMSICKFWILCSDIDSFYLHNCQILFLTDFFHFVP